MNKAESQLIYHAQCLLNLAHENEQSEETYRALVARQFDDLIAYVNLMMETSVTHAERRGQLLMLVAKINHMRGTVTQADDIPF